MTVHLLIVYFASFISLYFLGYGLFALGVQKKIATSSFFIIPWLGTVFILIVGNSLTLSKLGMQDNMLGVLGFKAYMMIWFLTIVFILYTLFVRRKSLPRVDIKILITLCILGVIVLFMQFKPLSYSILLEKSQYYLQASVIENIFAEKRFTYNSIASGVAIINSFFSSSFAIDSVLAMRITVAIYVVFFIGALFYVIKRFNIIFAVLSSVIIGTILYRAGVPMSLLILTGIIFTAFILVAEITLKVINDQDYTYAIRSHDIVIAFSLSTLPSLSPLAFKAFLFIVLCCAISGGLMQKRKRILFELGKIAILTVVINPVIIALALTVH